MSEQPSEEVHSEDSNRHDTAPRKPYFPKFPIPVGKAHQKLLQAILCADHELASWIDRAVITGNITGPEERIAALRERLDEVMEPLAPQI